MNGMLQAFTGVLIRPTGDDVSIFAHQRELVT